MGDGEDWTTYSASVETPAGLIFTTAVIVPESAAYPDQHELGELAQMGASHMLSVEERSVRRRRGDQEATEAGVNGEPVHECSDEGPARVTGGEYVRCRLLNVGDELHAGPHHDGFGRSWVFDPWLKPTAGKVLLLDPEPEPAF